VSVNDVVTAAVALAAVVVSVVGLLINNIIGKRAARSSLTDLSIKIHDKAAKYKKADASQQADTRRIWTVWPRRSARRRPHRGRRPPVLRSTNKELTQRNPSRPLPPVGISNEVVPQGGGGQESGASCGGTEPVLATHSASHLRAS
jgi:hypothetical protein